ncbi:hypothetical protein [Falsibacillus albus]|uniref:hypothetical protein n=1 Tax=Falsibacillus albus TaxID=2478915 RepID=UPI001F17CEC6|nr:hypothetical protein [Falsibacillus albus]
MIGIDKSPVRGEAGLEAIIDATLGEVDLNEIESLLLPWCMDIFKINKENLYINFIRKLSVLHEIKIASIASSPFY